MPVLSRRDFFRQIACGARRASAGRRGPVLVCVFLRGGADTLSLLVPHGDDGYYRARPTLAVPRPGSGTDSCVGLDGFYGLHPRLAPLHPLYRDGRLGFVQAVGSDNPTGSHFEAQDQVEHGAGFERGRTPGGGWLGRHLRLAGSDAGPLSAIAIGTTLPEALRGAPAASAITTLDDLSLALPAGDPDAFTRALGAMYAAQADELGDHGRETLALLERVRALRTAAYVPDAAASYGTDEFSRGLKEIARLIKADVGLEVATIDLAGWDTHFVQGQIGGLIGGRIETLATGLAAFDTDLAAHRGRVTTLVLTEFGRRTYENSSLGTDHGRGFAVMALGAGIAGGKVHGRWPGLEAEANADGPGGLAVAIDYRSVLTEVLAGPLGQTRCAEVFPDFSPEHVGLVAG